MKNQTKQSFMFFLLGVLTAVAMLHFSGKLRTNEKYEAEKNVEELLDFLEEMGPSAGPGEEM